MEIDKFNELWAWGQKGDRANLLVSGGQKFYLSRKGFLFFGKIINGGDQRMLPAPLWSATQILLGMTHHQAEIIRNPHKPEICLIENQCNEHIVLPGENIV